MIAHGGLLRDTGRWRQEAECRDLDPRLFFPVGASSAAIGRVEAAKAVCGRCEVTEPCLDFALTTNQNSGVWGGHSEEERRQLRRERAQPSVRGAAASAS